jgi:hypothetical protein
MISVSSGYKTELAREVGAKPVILIDCDFTTGHRRFALWAHDISFGGNTYVGLGEPHEIDAPQFNQGSPLSEQFLRFFVQNDPSLLADLQQNCRGRFCSGYLVFLNDSGVLVNSGESIWLWRKRMIPGNTSGDAGTYGADIALESRLHRHRNRAPRTYSHAEQRRRDASDNAFIDSGKSLQLNRGDWRQRSGLA